MPSPKHFLHRFAWTGCAHPASSACACLLLAATPSWAQDVYIGPGEQYIDEVPEGSTIFQSLYLFENDGRYLKQGGGTMEYQGVGGTQFINRGHLRVAQGTLGFLLNTGSATWDNRGLVELAPGSQLDIQVERYNHVYQRGTVRIGPNARFSISMFASPLESSGTWEIARGGRLDITGWSDYYHSPYPGDSYTGTLHNQGRVSFLRGTATFSAGATIAGGEVQVLHGSKLLVEADLRLGALRVDEAMPHEYAPPIASVVQAGGAVHVGELRWGQGLLSASGPITVSGLAHLSAGAYRPGPNGSDLYDKRLDTELRMDGGGRWDGDADITGTGSMHVAAGAVFEDLHTADGRDDGGGPVPLRVALGSFDNRGTFLKTGAAATRMATPFSNTGTVRVQDAGTLTFTRQLDNPGTLEAVRSRIVVWGGLVQLRHTAFEGGVSTELTGGRLRADGGTILLNVGEASNDPDWRPRLGYNAGALVYKGAASRITTSWLGDEVDLLFRSLHNDGQLSVLDDARLPEGLHLRNTGRVEIDERSHVHVSSYDQGSYINQHDIRTLVAGTLAATYSMSFSQGTLGAGLGEDIGIARLLGADVWLSASSVLDLDIASAVSFDRFLLDHALRLSEEASLFAEFDLTGPVVGRYRIVEAAGGVIGSFASLRTNLDASVYHWSVVYGDDYVELAVSTAPEPGTSALLAVGLLGVAALSRRRTPLVKR
ncbi:PEP-CTERM sorting domain-containing protein [Aquabacterium sp. A7-Y]|uniref:PEP-CTERM sorting domain-containing protein n=1 Tax=Aquabacterium sp. A7-Y TaxID=1349605 RepID=UPI00223D5DAE|nr:PEP-CTERM sorting domain-containing protein [Aquabacterium sp. A7-Y]MCW7540437.1 PEP-CTERM sorting domain-containing protein [Aquabacterium sp. A7-Y]